MILWPLLEMQFNANNAGTLLSPRQFMILKPALAVPARWMAGMTISGDAQTHWMTLLT